MVLVIDDVPEIVHEMVVLLDLVGIVAEGVQTLQAALATISCKPTIRIVICDVRLSRETGTELPGLVRNDPALSHRDLRYLFMTGDPLQLKSLGTEFNWLMLSKPVQPRMLIAHVQKLLEETRANT